MVRPDLSPTEVHAFLPFEWRPAPTPDLERLAADGRDAARWMTLMLGFEEIFSTSLPVEASSELTALTLRIDGLLQWVLATHAEDPDWRHRPRPIVLKQTVLHWQEPSGCSPGQWGMVRFYPNPRLPRSLAFWVEIDEVRPVESAGWSVRALWRGQDEEIRELFGKLLFRLHRQEVAQARRGHDLSPL
jgi:hypothetical protein